WLAVLARYRNFLLTLRSLLDSWIVPLLLCRSFRQRPKHLLHGVQATRRASEGKVFARYKGACDRVQKVFPQRVLALAGFLGGSTLIGPKGCASFPAHCVCYIA